MKHLNRQAVSLVFVALCAAGSGAWAQDPRQPAEEQPGQRTVNARLEVVLQLRQRLLTSGLTPEQIRARLRAEGYPENLLDAYFPGGTGVAGVPTPELYRAIEELGFADSADVAFLRLLQSDSLSAKARDSLMRRRDTVSRRDTLGSARQIVVRSDIADSIAQADSGFNIFGLSIFHSATDRFDPNEAGAVDANYRIGPGDKLALILTGDVEQAYALDVTREGFIVIPQVGQIFVANLTLGQLDDVLYTRLGRVYSGVRRTNGSTRFSVSVSKLRSNQVFVLGEVERPGSYQVSSAGTAMHALYAAGGPTANGGFRSVLVRRGERVVGELDLYDYLLRGDASRDARLESGDIVFVPPRGGRVRVLGEVIRPATYELKPGETLADLIRAAGGFRPEASTRRVHIERILPPQERVATGRERVAIDVPALTGDAPPVRMEGGDVVRVLKVAERVRNMVEVRGHVWQPGPQGIRPGMRITDAIRLAGGPKPDVYLGQILISRLQSDSTRVQLRASLADSTGAVVNDFPLREDDVIEVFALTRMRPDRYVFIGGAVRRAGRFPWREGITMRDLVLMAGGLQESAYLREAEIARLPEDRTGMATANTLRVPLDSTYLFDRVPGQPYPGSPGVQSPADGAPEVELKPYDNVLILRQPSWELQRVVSLSGEVKFPGQYTLRSRNERLADLIDRAGGFTSEAYPEGMIFVRTHNDIGRVGIDLPRAMARRNSPDNVGLIDGDLISIPQRVNIVTVRGAVNAPNVVAYVPGKDIFYYIDQAGGGSRSGDLRRAFITQPNGKREVRSITNSSPRPMPGSLVVVPEIDPSSRTNWAGIIAGVGPVVLGLLTLIVSLQN